MHVLVTGACGFIGSQVVRSFESNGVLTVNLLDIRTNLDLSSHSVFLALFDRVKRVREDVIIVHLADFVDARESLSNPKKYFGNNLALAYHVAQLGALENVKKIVFTSSAAVYGDPQYIPIDKEHPTRPKSPYGLAKLYEEQLLQLFSEEYGYALTILRLFNVYGEAQEKGLFGAIFSALRNGTPLEVFGDGNQERDYIYVGDVAESIVRAATTPLEGVFNVASGVGTSVNTIVEWVQERFPLRVVHVDPIPGEIRKSIGKPDIKVPPISKQKVWSVIENTIHAKEQERGR